MCGMTQLPVLDLCNQYTEIFLREGMGSVHVVVKDISYGGNPVQITVRGMFADDTPLCTRIFLAEHLAEITHSLGKGPGGSGEGDRLYIQKQIKEILDHDGDGASKDSLLGYETGLYLGIKHHLSDLL